MKPRGLVPPAVLAFLPLALAAAVGAGAGLAPALGLGALLAASLVGASALSAETGLALLLCAMLLSPEFDLGGGGGSLKESSRGVTIRLDDLLLAALCLGWWLRLAVTRRLRVPAPARIAVPMATYIGVCVLSTLLGMAAGRVRPLTGALFVLKYFEFFTVFLASLGPLSEPGRCRRYLGLLAAVACVVCVVALLQIPSGERISAPFEGDAEPNTLGGYLVVVASVVAGLMLEGAGAWPRMGAFLLPLFGVTLVFTLSRSSWLSAFVAVLAFVALSRQRVLIAGVCLPLVVLAPFVLPKSVKERAAKTFNEQSQQEQVSVGAVRLDASLSARLLSWRKIFRDWARQPLLGAGVTGYGFVDTQYVKILADTGLAGLGAFLWFLGALAAEGVGWFHRARSPHGRGLALGFLAALAGLSFHALGTNSFLLVRVMEPFCFVAAALVAGTPGFEIGQEAT
ncbi:MAG: O-antigen ligase family protein [Deltaproteobacteria bacterium]|nr:O-antigen ligase family protein [Deltaproteobacteria bacterium]